MDTSGGDTTVGGLAVRMTAPRELYDLIGRVNGSRNLDATLQAVLDGVVQGLGMYTAKAEGHNRFAHAGADRAGSLCSIRSQLPRHGPG